MSDNLDLSVSITTEEPEIAATLFDLRYLVFQGMKGEPGEDGVSFVPAYLDDGVVRRIEDDSIYTSATMWSNIDNGVVPLIYYISAENAHVYFELDYGDITGATPIVYFRSKDYLLSVDSTGAYTLTDRPQGGSTITVDDALSSTSENPVQNKVVKAALDGNVGKTTLLNLLIPILRQGLYGTDQETAISALETALGGTPEPVNPIETYTPTMSDGYINVTTGATGGTSTYKHTEIIPVREGDKVYGTTFDSTYNVTVQRIRARFTAAYDENSTIYPNGGSGDQHDYAIDTPLVVPSGVYGVVFSIVNSLANDVVVYVDKSERVGA